MNTTDQMMLKITNVENAVVYVVKGKTYKWINHLDTVINNGTYLFDTRQGWNYYVVGLGNNFYRGTFELSAWIESAPPEPKVDFPVIINETVTNKFEITVHKPQPIPIVEEKSNN